MEEMDVVRKGEEHNYVASRAVVNDSASLVEDLVGLYSSLAGLIKDSKVAPDDEIIAGGQFLLACRYQLVLGALTALRGHLNDSFYFSRKAIELCAFAARVKKHPHLAMVWLQAWHDASSYEKFREKFAPGKLYSEDHEVLGELYKRYDHCSKMVHPSVYSFGGHIEVKQSETEFNLIFEYFQIKDEDRSEPIRTLLWIVDTHFGILRVFEQVLDKVIKHDAAGWQTRRDSVDSKIAAHKAKWKPIILSSGQESAV